MAASFCRAQGASPVVVDAQVAEALQVVSRLSVKIEAAPQALRAEDANDVRLLAKYQQHERDACRWLDKILNELSSRRTWRSVEEVMREIDWTGLGECPFLFDSGLEGRLPTSMGTLLSRELKILVSKYGETQVSVLKRKTGFMVSDDPGPNLVAGTRSFKW